MEAPAVRVQLPGGEVFASAFVEAIERYASRRGFSTEGTERFVSILEPSIVAVHTAAPSAVELIVIDEGDTIRTELRAIDPRHHIADAAAVDIEAAAASVAEVDTDGAVVRFTIVID